MEIISRSLVENDQTLFIPKPCIQHFTKFVKTNNHLEYYKWYICYNEMKKPICYCLCKLLNHELNIIQMMILQDYHNIVLKALENTWIEDVFIINLKYTCQYNNKDAFKTDIEKLNYYFSIKYNIKQIKNTIHGTIFYLSKELNHTTQS